MENPFKNFGRKKNIEKEVSQLVSSADIEAYKYSNYNIDIDSALSRKGYSLYTKEMMADDQIKACVLIKKLGVTVGGYTIQAAVGESEEGYEKALEIAKFTDYCLKRMKGSVERLLYNISHAIVPGFSVLEIVWEVFKDGQYKGKIGIKEIKVRPAHTFTFDMDEYGNVRKLIQNIDGKYIEVPVEKVLLYTYDPQATGLPMGVSDLRAAYKHWWSKDALMRFRNVAAEKFSCPTIKGIYPSHFTSAMQSKFLRTLKSFSVATAFIIPEGAQVELIEAKGSVVMPYDASIDNCNKGMARAVFGQILATDEGNTGSFAQAKIHRGILGMFLSGIRNEIGEEVIKEQLFKRLVAYNFSEEDGKEYVPSMILGLPDERDLGLYTNLINMLITNDAVDENEPFVRELFSLPPKPKELIERDKKLKEQAALNSQNEQNADSDDVQSSSGNGKTVPASNTKVEPSNSGVKNGKQKE